MGDMFGIRVAGNGEPDEFYVGKNEVLWDWLVAEDNEPDLVNASEVLLTAPTGYLFHYGCLIAEYALNIFDDTSRTHSVDKDSVDIAKFYFLLANLNQVEPVQFYSLGLDRSRIKDIIRPMEFELFGIRVKDELEGSDGHYVGYDSSLYDWLMADNYEPSDREAHYKVKAPEGYGFLYGNLSPQNAEDDWDDFEYVKSDSPQNDKALMLLESLQYAEPEEFYSRGISEDRVLDFLLD